MLYKQMQNTFKNVKNTNNKKNVQTMQQTFQTNDKNINKYQKQFVVITIAKKHTQNIKTNYKQ